MRRILSILAVCTLALAGCGGGHHAAHRTTQPVQSAMGSVHPPGWGATPPGFSLPAPLPTAVPTAEMYDAVTLSNVPSNPFAVAGYIAGNWPTWFSLARDFPRAHHVSIAIHFGQHAMCGDFEPGDMSPSQAGAWALADIRAGFPMPCEYSDLSNMPEIQTSDRAAFGPNWRAHVLLWLAWYTDRPGLTPGYDADQFTDHALGRNLDENTVSLNFLRIASPPYVAPKPKPVLPVCFSHRITASQCTAAKAKVAAAERGAQSSLDAYLARGCDVLKARERWFANAIAHDHSAHGRARLTYRKGALATTRKVESRQQCGLFTGRVDYFLALENQIKAAN